MISGRGVFIGQAYPVAFSVHTDSIGMRVGVQVLSAVYVRLDAENTCAPTRMLT